MPLSGASRLPVALLDDGAKREVCNESNEDSGEIAPHDEPWQIRQAEKLRQTDGNGRQRGEKVIEVTDPLLHDDQWVVRQVVTNHPGHYPQRESVLELPGPPDSIEEAERSRA